MSISESNVFHRGARLVLRFRVLVLVLTLLLTGYLGHRAARDLRINNSTDLYMPSDGKEMAALRALRESFGDDQLFLMVVEGEVFTDSYLHRLRTLHESLDAFDFETTGPPEDYSEAVSGRVTQAAASSDEFEEFEDHASGESWGETGGGFFDEITSLINVRHTTMREGALHVGGRLDEWSGGGLETLKKDVLSDRSLVGQVIGAGAGHSVVILRSQPLNEVDSRQLSAVLRKVAEEQSGEGFRLYLAGWPTVTAALADALKAEQAKISAASGLALILLLWLFFRHPIGFMGPLVVVAMSVVWTLGAMTVVGIKLTAEVQIVLCFIQIVGIGDTVHIISVYRGLRRQGVANDKAICGAVATTGLPILFTTLTTAAGLMSFLVAETPPIRYCGLFGALGVFVALVLSFTVMPALLSYNTKSLLGVSAEDKRSRDWLDRLLAWGAGLSRPTPTLGNRPAWRVAAFAAVFTLTMSFCASRARVAHDPLRWFPEDSALRVAFRTIDEHVGGAANLELVVQALPGSSLWDRGTLVALERLEQHALAYEDEEIDTKFVTNVTSVLDVIRESNRALHGGDIAHYRLPDSQRAASDLFTLFEGSGPGQLKRLMTVDGQRTVMTLRVRWFDSTLYERFLDHINAGATEFLGPYATVHVTGNVSTNTKIAGALIRDLSRSVVLAFCLITVIMVALYRDLKLGLVAMVPNLTPAIAVLGVMYLVDIPLDAASILLSSLILGVAVDDTIHFMHQFHVHYGLHGSVDDAIDAAMNHAGRALVSTSTILFLGFGTYLVGDLGTFRVFGVMMTAAIVVALVADLVFAPALLRLMYKDVPARGASPNHSGFESPTPALETPGGSRAAGY
ncbi:MAG: MMPL family transporter [Polyangiaceae bacterium]|nr:MMPL family transporter [Polyangiaceae bacterium]